MDTSLHGTSGRVQYLGICQFLRSIPGKPREFVCSICTLLRLLDLLRYRIPSIAIRDLMDWISPDLPPVRCRGAFWTSYGCRPFQIDVLRRFRATVAGGLHDIPVYRVLAAVPGARDMHWDRWW